MPEIIAVTRDDIEHRFSCAAGAFVLDAAEEAGLYLPSVCRHGRCGTCWAQVVSGAYALAPFEPKAAPAAPDAVLLCRCRPREDMVVRLPCRDAQIGRRALPLYQARVEAVTREDDDWLTASLRLDAAGEELALTPGQSLEVNIPGTGLWQALAPVRPPEVDGVLEFVLPRGAGAAARWLHAARRGAAVQLRGPLGHFTLDEMSPYPRCFIGAGAGLAPLLALLAQAARARGGTRLLFIFAAAPAAQGFVARRLAEWRAKLPQLAVELVADEADAALAAALARLPRADVYACGPAPFTAAAAAAARAAGVAEAQVHCAALPALAEDEAALSGP